MKKGLLGTFADFYACFALFLVVDSLYTIFSTAFFCGIAPSKDGTALLTRRDVLLGDYGGTVSLCPLLSAILSQFVTVICPAISLAKPETGNWNLVLYQCNFPEHVSAA